MATKKKQEVKKYHLLTADVDWGDEHDVPCLEVFSDEDYKIWRKMEIYPSASLGNNGEGWMEDWVGSTGAELMKGGIVSHFTVDESFYKNFKRAKLSSLSLGNLFNFNQYVRDKQTEYTYDEEGMEVVETLITN